MIQLIGFLLIFLVIVLLWLARVTATAVHNYRRKHNPDLPLAERRSFRDTAEVVLRHIAPIPDPPPQAHVRRHSVYSRAGVTRAHPDCESDPELPHYTFAPTASMPAIIIEDEYPPPPPTPPPGEAQPQRAPEASEILPRRPEAAFLGAAAAAYVPYAPSPLAAPPYSRTSTDSLPELAPDAGSDSEPDTPGASGHGRSSSDGAILLERIVTPHAPRSLPASPAAPKAKRPVFRAIASSLLVYPPL